MNQEETPRVEIVNNTPIMHWDLKKLECKEIKAAAKYTWKCLEKLALVFCKFYCDRQKCNIEKIASPKSEVTGIGSDEWEKTQKEFHRCMSFLMDLNLNYNNCFACDVTRAFSFFPILYGIFSISTNSSS